MTTTRRAISKSLKDRCTPRPAIFIGEQGLSYLQRDILERYACGEEPIDLLEDATEGRWTREDAESWLEYARDRGGYSPTLWISHVIELGACDSVPTKPIREILLASAFKNRANQERLPESGPNNVVRRAAAALGVDKRSVYKVIGKNGNESEKGFSFKLTMPYEQAVILINEFGIDPLRVGV